jgi:hypothetical protein
MTINEFSHYSIDSGYLYIYKTPADATYTIGVIGTRKPDAISESPSSDSTNIAIDPDLLWGLIYSTLEKVAEINNAVLEANRYRLLKEEEKKRWRKRAEQSHFVLDKIQPYSLL